MPRDDRHRLGLTLTPYEYTQIRAYARRAGKPLATVAKRAILDVAAGPSPEAAPAALARERERVRQLEAEVTRLQAHIDKRQVLADLRAALPRWRWPLDALLGDQQWWDEWLPLLGELIGRHLEYDHPYGEVEADPVVDERGFGDLLTYLFPPIPDARGRSVPWHTTGYPRHAHAAWTVNSAASRRKRPVRAEVWEPVVRHVARALTALETTSQTPGDAYTHLRVEAEIRGEWMRTLGAIIGEDGAQRPDQLPRLPLP
jgi:hypothetical protein